MDKTVFISDNRCAFACEAAVYLAKLGYHVVMNHLGGKSISGMEYRELDLCDCEALSRYFKSCGNRLYAVVHSAPPPLHASIEKANDIQWEKALHDGALSALMLTRAAGACLAGLGRGALIYIGSIHAEKPMGYGFLYSIGCSAVQMLCREAALDFGESNVNCFYIQRGVVEEDMPNRNDISNVYHGVQSRYIRKRLPRPDYLNELVAFLLGDGASPLIGSELHADEGFTLYYGRRIREGVNAL